MRPPSGMDAARGFLCKLYESIHAGSGQAGQRNARGCTKAERYAIIYNGRGRKDRITGFRGAFRYGLFGNVW
jgi:hypothetical protein